MGHGDSYEVTFLSQTRKSRWQRERPPPQHLQMEIYGSLTETLQRAGWKCFVTDWSRPQPPQTDQRRCYVSIHHSGQQAITQGSWKDVEKSWSVIDQMHHPLRHPDTVWKAGWHTYYSRLLKVLQKDLGFTVPRLPSDSTAKYLARTAEAQTAWFCKEKQNPLTRGRVPHSQVNRALQYLDEIFTGCLALLQRPGASDI